MLDQTRAACGAATGQLEDLVAVTIAHPDVARRRDTRGSNRDVGTPGGLAGCVSPLQTCLVQLGPETDRILLYGGLSPHAVRACDGLSWNTPAGFNLTRSRARGYGQMGVV